MTWTPDGPQGNEAAKIKNLIVPYTRGRGLDLGCGPWKAWPHFVSVDNFDEWRGIGDWHPDVPGDATDLSIWADNSLDFVFSSHLLEHIEDTEATLTEWWRVIKPGGHLVLYLPHKDLYPNIGEEGSNPDHKHDFLPGDIDDAMVKIAEETGWGWLQVEDETRSEGNEYSFFQVYRKSDVQDECYDRQPWIRPEKSCLVIRYGAFGDQIMAAAILPGLKEQGYHITYNTTPKGHSVIQHDPHIDAFLIQDKDQVPNGPELPAYFEGLATRYDKVVNLCESIEVGLLTHPGRSPHHNWSPEALRKILGKVNYVERTCDIAGVPHNPGAARFYATAGERAWAKEFKRASGAPYLILWCLAGVSSQHKTYPYVNFAAVQLTRMTPARVLFIGDKSCRPLEESCAGTFLRSYDVSAETLDEIEEADPEGCLQTMADMMREIVGYDPMIFTSGGLTIRQSMLLAMEADLVVGPETGVMNAVAQEEMPKVVMLSHSSHDNLTRDWSNTTVIQPDVPCYPCHRIHYDMTHCHESEDVPGAAACATAIDEKTLVQAIMNLMPPPENFPPPDGGKPKILLPDAA